MSILEQEEVEAVDQEDNKHRQIQSNKMRDRNTYLEELVMGHHLIISCLLLEKEREVKRNKKLHVSQQPFPYLGGQKNRTERKKNGLA